MIINRANELMYFLPCHEMHYIGLNRTPYEGELDKVKASNDETDWLIGEFNYAFPQLNLKRTDIIYSYVGIQPVTYDESDPQASLKVVVHDLESDGIPNVLMLTGGPISNYRHIAKKLLKAVLKRCVPKLRKQSPSSCSSKRSDLTPYSQATSVDMKIPENIIKKIILEEQPISLADILLRGTGVSWVLSRKISYL